MCWKVVLLAIFILAKPKFAEETPNDELNLNGNKHNLETLELRATNQIQKSLEPVSRKKRAIRSRPRNCKEVQERGHNTSDIYIIQPRYAPRPIPVLCDLETRGGGWTFILNRFDGTQDFFLNWKDYKDGFGSLTGELWLGLENIHLLTGYEVNELLIELVDWDKKNFYAHYNSFIVGNENGGYALKALGKFTGNVEDNFRYNDGRKFSTNDRDQDDSNQNCALHLKGGWWYTRCSDVLLTSRYLGKKASDDDAWTGRYWFGFSGPLSSLKEARMMVRPRDNTHPEPLPHKKRHKYTVHMQNVLLK